MISLGVEPNAVDLMTFLDGLSYEEGRAGVLEAEVLGIRVNVLGIEAYVVTKRASGRPKDLADLALLAEVLGRDL